MTSPPTTPVEVSRALAALTERLYEHVRAYKIAEEKAVAARAKADRAEDLAFLKAEGSMDLRKHTARLAASDAEEEALVAEAAVRVMKHKIDAIKVDIEAHRTYGATVRAEFQTLGYQP